MTEKDNMMKKTEQIPSFSNKAEKNETHIANQFQELWNKK